MSVDSKSTPAQLQSRSSYSTTIESCGSEIRHLPGVFSDTSEQRLCRTRISEAIWCTWWRGKL